MEADKNDYKAILLRLKTDNWKARTERTLGRLVDMLGYRLLYLASLITFTFGALTFSVLTLFYWRE